MIEAPWTNVGALQQDVSELKSQMYRKADQHEIHSLNSKLDGLERANGELRSDVHELRRQLDQLRETFRQSLDVLGQMTNML